MFTRNSNRIAEAVRLLAAVGAAAADPTLFSALKSAPSAYDTLKAIAAAPPSSVGRLAETLAAEAQTLFDNTGDVPPDADVLYLQMVEIGMVGATEIVAEAMDADAVTEAMLGKLTEVEHKAPGMQALFRALTKPVLARLLADKNFAADLTPAFMQSVLGQIAGLGEKLDQLDRLNRLEMEALANRFEIEPIFALNDAALREALEKRAEDYRAYKVRIEAIDERTAELGNLKAAAKDAAERLDFDEVEQLLARVDAVETEIAADTKELRAENALLRGRVDAASACLSAAADGFASVAPLEPARRRLRYCKLLHGHGLRYGGPGIALAERTIRRALDDLVEEREPALWACGQVWLGIALSAQGERVGGKAGAELLGKAVMAYRAALRIQTDPVELAKTQNNLFAALRVLSERVGGEAGAALLGEAAVAFRAARRVLTKKAHPVEWAILQMNRGVELRTQAVRSGGEASAKLLCRAVAAYHVALRVLTEAEHPAEWAEIQSNLGIALSDLGEGISGEAGAELLGKAVMAYRAALRSFTNGERPVDRARIQNNLGTALFEQGKRVGGEAGAKLLWRAVAVHRAALRVRTEAAHPVDWAMTMENLGLVHEALAGNAACADPRAALTEATRCLESALRVFDPEHMPHNHAKASKALARVRGKLAGG